MNSIPFNESDRRQEVLSSWVWQDLHTVREGLGGELPHSTTLDLAAAEPGCTLFSLDTEAATSMFVGEDSDAASASSRTSGYESATPTAARTGPAQDHTHGLTQDLIHGPAQEHTNDHTLGYTHAQDHTHGHAQDHTHSPAQDHTHSPALYQGFWDQLVKKYDGILQTDCQSHNHSNTKVGF
ncbi:hypothetical protein DPEC_G00375380 [Dallia pectoralis]|nr:hypothetical protein DPEC_G00375380 [Dallia pectoralis]